VLVLAERRAERARGARPAAVPDPAVPA
jgi:hypothetical protein